VQFIRVIFRDVSVNDVDRNSDINIFNSIGLLKFRVDLTG
jgi:hypothetical protein